MGRWTGSPKIVDNYLWGAGRGVPRSWIITYGDDTFSANSNYNLMTGERPAGYSCATTSGTNTCAGPYSSAGPFSRSEDFAAWLRSISAGDIPMFTLWSRHHSGRPDAATQSLYRSPSSLAQHFRRMRTCLGTPAGDHGDHAQTSADHIPSNHASRSRRRQHPRCRGASRPCGAMNAGFENKRTSSVTSLFQRPHNFCFSGASHRPGAGAGMAETEVVSQEVHDGHLHT